jgi:ABC-2 type transport system permease protein
MSAITASARGQLSRLTFGGVLRSEWIKLRSLRSTAWCYAIVIAVTIGLGALYSWNSQGQGSTADGIRSLAVGASTLGVNFAQLVVAVLGALMITGEYGTGMIRSTLAAVPKRLPALIAKCLVFGVATFVVSAVALAGTAVACWLVLSNNGIHPDFFDSRVLLPLVGAAGYLALIGMLSLALGAIIRSSAGGIAVALGLILVAPLILRILVGVTRAVWPVNVSAFLPNSAGGLLWSYTSGATPPAPSGYIVLTTLQGGLILGAWVVVAFVIAAILLKRRDA